MTQAELKEQMKAAMKAKETVKLNVIRGLLSAMTNEAVTKGKGPDGVLNDGEVLAVISRASKQRKDSIAQFEAGGRPELAVAEKEELVIIEAYLPAQMSHDEITAAAKAKAAEMGVVDKTGVNKLMSSLMKDLKGRADGTLVKAIVDQMFV